MSNLGFDLKPCPFCGGTNLEIVTMDTRDREGWPRAISCEDCGAQGPWLYTLDADGKVTLELAEAWNGRA